MSDAPVSSTGSPVDVLFEMASMLSALELVELERAVVKHVRPRRRERSRVHLRQQLRAVAALLAADGALTQNDYERLRPRGVPSVKDLLFDYETWQLGDRVEPSRQERRCPCRTPLADRHLAERYTLSVRAGGIDVAVDVCSVWLSESGDVQSVGGVDAGGVQRGRTLMRRLPRPRRVGSSCIRLRRPS